MLSPSLSAAGLLLLTALAWADPQAQPPSSPKSPSSCTSSTITVQGWPFSAPTPTPLAHILQTNCSPEPPTFSVLDWQPPPHEPPTQNHVKARYAHWDPASTLVRVGYYDDKCITPEQKFMTWDGIVTDASAFTPGMKKIIYLHLDVDNNFVHVAFSGTKEQMPFGAQEVFVEAKPVVAGPKPFLNKPVVLDESGKVKTEEKDERTFLQKYWWLIAVFILMQVVSAGAKE